MRWTAVAMLAIGAAATPAAAQWTYKAGDIVEANPTGTDTPESWVPCRVLERGPGAGNYKTACALPWARTGPMTSEGYAPERRMRPMTVSPQARARREAAAARFQAGQTVLASPAQLADGWQRCRVLARMAGVTVPGERKVDNYQIECVNDTSDPYGRRIQTLGTYWTKETWMRPDQPGFKPYLQLATARGQEAARSARATAVAAQLARPAPAAPARAAAGGGSPPPGSYECWANGAARMTMNFRVTGAGAYRNDSGAGRFSVGPGGRMTLTGPMLEAMPDGFVAVYHAPGGRPTVSFRSPRGAEAAFCERQG